MRICVIIPAYNEAGNITRLIQDIKKYQLDPSLKDVGRSTPLGLDPSLEDGKVYPAGLEILVIDDGSSDKTFQIANNSGVHVMFNLNNQGKGASLIKGFKYALDNNFDAVITIDADGQHLPQDLPLFIESAKNQDIHIILGNRMLNTEGMPRLRVVTNKFMSWLISTITKQVIPDTQCGFRLIKKEVLKKIKLRTSKYETESEILIEASRLGFKINSIPIKSVYRRGKSRINPFIDTLRFIKLILKG